MITVIIAGGSGTRLWPLSTSKYPKHLLKLLGDRTLLQTAYDRASKISDNIYIVTESSHSDYVKSQLSELPDSSFIIEPGRRGTAHCIALALDYISRRHDNDEPIAFIHSDHHVNDIGGFSNSFKKASKVSKDFNRIVLIGIKPTYPATGFGYIKRDIDNDGILDDVYDVSMFKEKPDYDTALQYIESGDYLWNCGYFVGSVNVFVDEMKKNSPVLYDNFNKISSIKNINDSEYDETYLNFDNQVIDVALIEKTKNLSVVSAGFDWMDIGSFKDLHDVVSKDESGNYLSGQNIHTIEVENVYIRNEDSDRPVAVIGLDNVVVVNTPDGILISRKDISHKTGEIAKKIQN